MENNVCIFPFSDTPMWEYLLMYCKYREKSEGAACVYVETTVPDQLKDQVYTVGKQMLEYREGR